MLISLAQRRNIKDTGFAKLGLKKERNSQSRLLMMMVPQEAEICSMIWFQNTNWEILDKYQSKSFDFMNDRILGLERESESMNVLKEGLFMT